MKMRNLVVLSLTCFWVSLACKDITIIEERTPEAKIAKVRPEPDQQHYLIEFRTAPTSVKQHGDWIEGIEKGVASTSKILLDRKLIAPHRYSANQKKDLSFLERTLQASEQFFYDAFFQTHTLTYPQKRNYPFFTARNDLFGSMGVFAPDGVSPKVFLEILRAEIMRQGVDVRIMPDLPIYSDTAAPDSLAHVAFTYPVLKQLRQGDLKLLYERELKQITFSNRMQTSQQSARAGQLRTALKIFDDLEEQLFWYQEIPTTGIRLETDILKRQSPGSPKKRERPWNANYPFLPHQFPLWQMAEKLGEGITIAVIDTGIAAFDIEKVYANSSFEVPKVRKNIDLTMHGDFSTRNYNLVHSTKLNPLEGLISMIGPKLDRNKFQNGLVSYIALEKESIKWVYEYLEKGSVDGLRAYLTKQSSTHHLASDGSVRADVLDKAKKELAKFHLVKITDPVTGNPTRAVLEFLPIAPIFSDNSKTISIGHGSHVSGIAAGRLQNDNIRETNYQPLTDEGVCGVAPKAKVVMIKGFTNEGTSYQSTLISALILALSEKAHVVNMSLKSADFLNPKSGHSQTLERIINLIPYCVASSGNDGDPTKAGHLGRGIHVEAYPARLSGIAFDVGAFAYDYKTRSCPIAAFSQYQIDRDSPQNEKGVSTGPKFVAPGFNILSCGLTANETTDSVAVVMQGTSMAAPMVSGFVALMLSEFTRKENGKEVADFTRDQFLKVCYKSGIKMMSAKRNPDWDQKSIFGSLDMRTALFTLHILRAFKQNSKKREKLLNKEFDKLLEVVHAFLFGMVNQYSNELLNGIRLKDDYCEFYKQVQEVAKSGGSNLQLNPIFQDFDKAVSFATEALLFATGEIKERPSQLSSQLLDAMRAAWNKTTINLFGDLKLPARNKVHQVFSTNKEIDDVVKRYLGRVDTERLVGASAPYKTYWAQQAAQL